jgi:hypothetical protein
MAGGRAARPASARRGRGRRWVDFFCKLKYIISLKGIKLLHMSQYTRLPASPVRIRSSGGGAPCAYLRRVIESPVAAPGAHRAPSFVVAARGGPGAPPRPFVVVASTRHIRMFLWCGGLALSYTPVGWSSGGVSRRVCPLGINGLLATRARSGSVLGTLSPSCRGIAVAAPRETRPLGINGLLVAR